MFADTNVESSEPIQPDTIGASSAIPSPQIEPTPEKVLYLLILLYFQTTCYFLTKFFLNHLQALNSPALSYSFNFEEYIDEDEISSSATSSKEALSEETRNRLRDILPMLEKDIADLVQDADPMQRIFLAIKDNLSPDLIKVLSPLSIIEDQTPKVKRLRGICLTVKL